MIVSFGEPEVVMHKIHELLKVVKPTELIAVPRVYEKWQSFIKMKMRQYSTTYQQLFEWAKDRGFKNTEAQQKGDLAPFGFSLSKFLVLKTIRKELGLEHVEQLFYGAAPMSNSTREFFAKLNMPVVGLYGLSETSGSATFQEFPQAKLDKVGYPLPGTQIKIYNPNDNGIGEVCIRGRNLFMGYFKNDKASWDAFDGEGYYHTGDTGFLDRENYL